MKRSILVVAAILAAAVLTSCNKCKDIKHSQLYKVTLTKDLAVSEYTPGSDTVSGMTVLPKGMIVQMFHAAGHGAGDNIEFYPGAELMDSTMTSHYLVNTHGMGDVMGPGDKMNPPTVNGCNLYYGQTNGGGTVVELPNGNTKNLPDSARVWFCSPMQYPIGQPITVPYDPSDPLQITFQVPPTGPGDSPRERGRLLTPMMVTLEP